MIVARTLRVLVDLVRFYGSIAIMAKCNAVYFCRGWETARGCKIEHEIAKNYGLSIIYEGD